ncbi:MAG: asparaginase [Betaproteobacteria bacterium]|nr:MAG: asparaginase [Betaproteobacteria bacterium]
MMGATMKIRTELPTLLILTLVLGISPAHSQDRLPLVKVVATGGTIANTPSGRLHAGEVAEAIPQLKKVARLEVEEVMRVGSSAITVEQWLTLAKRINEILAREPEVKGIVVTHGSNTVEETAYFLSLTVQSDKPVVLTAAQRQFTTLSSDSPKNFLQAVRVAAADEARGKGALVVTNDVINAARDVSKNISYRLETYSSRDIGALGFVDEDRVTFYRAPTRHPAPFDVTRLQKLPRVDVIYTYAGADGALMEAAVAQARAEGLVIAGFPTGSGTPAMDEVTKRFAARGIPVVMTNRGGMGRVIDTRPVERRPLIWGDNLTPQKARVLLMLALTRTRDSAELQRIFATY